MLSRTSKQATLAIVKLARLKPTEYLGASQIATEIGAPKNYLGKLLKQLAERGILESQKGCGGGFRLALSAANISVYDIVEPIDRVSKWKGCFLGQAKCSDETPCPVHKNLSAIREKYLQYLKETTIADIAKKETLPIE